MGEDGWRGFYASDLQGLYALLVVPAVFLAYAVVAGRGHQAVTAQDRFVHGYCLLFAAQTLIDPLATGPLARALPAAATALPLLFVLLGDFRVYLLLFHLETGARDLRASLLRAALWTPLVPVSAYAANAVYGALVGEPPAQLLWLLHELFFVAVALWLRRRARDDAFRRRAATYVVAYYALWAASDVVILLGIDVGWLLRVLPNQLYYAFWIPFVYFSYFSAGRLAEEETP